MTKTYQDQTGKTVNPSAFVHAVGGRFYVAEYSKQNAQFSGALRADVARKSGCSGFFCRTAAGLPGAGGYRYARKSAAIAKVVELYNLEVTG